MCFMYLIIFIYLLNINECSSHRWILIGVTTADVLEEYFKKHSPIYAGEEWRILYVDDEKYINMQKENNEESEKRNFEINSGVTYRSIGMTNILLIVTWILKR